MLFHSREDEEVSVDHLAKWGKRLPRAEVRELRGANHVLSKGDIGPVGAAIKAL